MHLQDFQRLLAYGESDWLDYKAELGPGIEQLGRPKDVRAHDQAELLKDLMCLANSPTPRRTRYLVRGVKSRHDGRITRGVTQPLDDADVQGWLQGKFDPPLRVQYWQWPLEDGRFVGVFEITSTPGVAHVPVRAQGKALVAGQVWWRQGSENQLPGVHGLRVLFGPPRPVPLVGWQFQDGSWAEHVAVDNGVHRLIEQARAAWPDKLQDAADRLAQVAAQPLPEQAPPRHLRVLNQVSPAIPARVDEKHIQMLLSDLEDWGVSVPPALLRPSGLWSDHETVWPNRWDPLDHLKVEGPGAEWYRALRYLVAVLEDFPREAARLRKLGERPQVKLEVRNIGTGPLHHGHLRLIPVGNVSFRFGPRARLPLKAKPGEVRPGPGGSADVLLGNLAPQAALVIPELPLQRLLDLRSVLRTEITAANLTEAVPGQVVIS